MYTEESNPLLNYFVENAGPAIDKWLHYFHIYHKAFSHYRGKSPYILEIGVQNGGSTKMWQNYFGIDAKVVCVDIDPECKKLESEGFEVWIGDQESLEFWDNFKKIHKKFDIIIEDGGHGMLQQINTFRALFPILSNGGVYLCEDTHTSYLPMLKGAGLKSKDSFVEFAKGLVDEIHGWYYKPLSELTEHDHILRSLDSVAFYDSIVIFEKKLKNPPTSLVRGFNMNKPISGFHASSYLDLRKMANISD